MIIVLGHLCGDGPFLFSRIGVEDAGIKKELPKQSIVPKRRADHSDRLSWPNGLICSPCLRTNWEWALPMKMTLGDSVNIVKGHFHSVLVSNIFVYLTFY